MSRNSLIWLALIAIFGLFIYKISDVLFPFITAIIFAYFLDPVVDRLEKLSLSRTLATSVIIAIFFLVIILLLILLLPIIYEQIITFANRLPEYKIYMQDKAIPYLSEKIQTIDQDTMIRTKKAIEQFSGSFFKYIITLLNDIWHSGLAIVNIFSLIFLTPIITFYLLRDWDIMVAKLDSYVPISSRDTIRKQLQVIDETLSGYVRGQTNVCLIMSVYYASMLSIVNLEFGLFIGIAAGLLSFIPYAGILCGYAIAVLTSIFQFASFTKAAIITIIFITGQLVESNFITPKLVGDRIGLHPVWMIFAMLAGAALFGFYGVLFAVPVAAIIGVIVRFFLDKYLSSSLYR